MADPAPKPNRPIVKAMKAGAGMAIISAFIAFLIQVLTQLGYIPSATPPAPAPAPAVDPTPPVPAKKASHRFTARRPRVPADHSKTGYLSLFGAKAVNPPLIDWRAKDSPIEDQGSAGACTSFGWSGALRLRARLAGLADFIVSHLLFYWGERSIEGTTCCDTGASVQAGAQVASKQGFAPETIWPYVLSKLAVQPPQSAFTAALANVVTPAPASVDNTDLDETRSALANGQAVVFGFEAYASLDDVGPDGLYKPSGEDLGGHCVAAIGYDDSKQVLICRNSWGTDWGASGYFFMPYSVYTDARTTFDAWTVPAAVPAPPKPSPAPKPDPPPSPTPAPAFPSRLDLYHHFSDPSAQSADPVAVYNAYINTGSTDADARRYADAFTARAAGSRASSPPPGATRDPR